MFCAYCFGLSVLGFCQNVIYVGKMFGFWVGKCLRFVDFLCGVAVVWLFDSGLL